MSDDPPDDGSANSIGSFSIMDPDFQMKTTGVSSKDSVVGTISTDTAPEGEDSEPTAQKDSQDEDDDEGSKHIKFDGEETKHTCLEAEVAALRDTRATHVAKRGRRRSTVYDLGGPQISGDFQVRSEDDAVYVPSQDSPLSSVSEEEEMEVEEETEEVVQINREEYLEEYHKLTEERKALRRKNNYLHKKMAENLKKRNLDSYLKESIPTEGIDLQEKYERRLKMFYDAMEWEKNSRKKLDDELEFMKAKLLDQKVELEQKFDAMLKREKEISNGLIDTKTGKVISDKLVQRLMVRQQSKMDEIGAIRLICFKIRDKVLEKEASLRGVETLGDNLHLVDYEQLRMENQNYGDKIEERDDELTKLRNKSTAAIQILAHLREKSFAVAVDINSEVDRLKDVDLDVAEARERVTNFKIRRDAYRAETQRLRESSGLLTRTKLLRDFETAVGEVEKTRKQLEAVTNSYETQKQELIDIRQTLEGGLASVEVIMKPKTVHGSRVYRGRPTLIYPELPTKKSSSVILKTIFTKPQ